MSHILKKKCLDKRKMLNNQNEKPKNRKQQPNTFNFDYLTFSFFPLFIFKNLLILNGSLFPVCVLFLENVRAFIHMAEFDPLSLIANFSFGYFCFSPILIRSCSRFEH